ncbi:hypothetical protein EF903_17920 [Streptomyces sp. WAC05292]|uniref:hypothetical protein n=1 Tax=Streptomyces sp. WAC05292 TaxID=2487418 RepID=UPI000F747621|nr:hypothetical protein [Streptomyces sp. WAC05292]RSS86990.1 hypothetical protein EF903_17920 [Streptomyces sp. WAC05292]
MSSTDYDKVRADAAAEVENELQGISDPFERRAKAEELRDQASMELSLLKPERDKLLAAAALYRYSRGMYAQFGIKYIQLKRITAAALGTLVDIYNPPPYPLDRVKAAKDAGLPNPDDLMEQAIDAAVRYEAAEARRDTALGHLEAAHEAVRTAGGRMKADAVERPDFEQVRQDAVDEIRKEFATLAVAPDERLLLAAQAVDQAEEEVAALLPERDEALLSLAFYTTARGIYESAGISRTGLARAQQKALGLPRDAKIPTRAEQPAAARAAGVKYLKDAAQELPATAKAYEGAKARQSAAIEIRDAVLPVLAAEPYNWGVDKLAEAIDRDTKIVRRVLDPEKYPTYVPKAARP